MLEKIQDPFLEFYDVNVDGDPIMNSCRKTFINLEEFLSLVIIRRKVGLLEDASWLRDGIFVGWMNTYHVASLEDLFTDFFGELVRLKMMFI